MRKHYPEDLTGESPDNIAEGSLKSSTYPNRFNLVVPLEAPFFRNGLEVKDTAGNLLFEGIDYYLALYYSEGAHAANAQLFGGIMLLTKTEITYKAQVLGSSYSVPESDIGIFLVNPELTEPRNIDWKSLMRYPITIDPIDPPATLAEALQRDEVAKSIDGIRLKIEAKAGQLDTEINTALTALSRAAQKLYADKLLQHHKTPHQHKYTPAQIGALAAGDAATNAVKAFSKTLAELVAIMVEHKISQRIVDGLLEDTMGQVFGRFRAINNDELMYATQDGKSALRFTAGKILLTGAEAVIELAADSDNNQRGVGVSSRAGYDELFVPSKGNAAGAKDVRPIYNGAFLITPESINLYLYAPLNSNAQPSFKSTSTVLMGGNGSTQSPLNMTAQTPAATNTVEGLFRLTDSVEVIAPNYALSQKGVNDLLLKLNNYVDETFKINNAAFGSTQTINLTALSFGLDKVNNTAPADKPVTQVFRDQLTTKALKVHTHVAADLQNVPTASPILSGLAYLAAGIDYTTQRAAVSKLGYQLKLDIDGAEDKANNLLPSWVASGTYYGDSGFLPIPTAGRYDGSSQQMEAALRANIGREENGKFYVLRNATSGYAGSEMVLYWTADVSETGAVSNPIPTTVEYVPVGLKAIAPNVKFKTVTVIGDECGIFQGTDNKYYLVMFDGTMNMAKHTRVSRVTLEALNGGTVDPITPSYFNTNEDRLVLTEGKVCLLKMYLVPQDFYTCIWTLDESLVGKTSDLLMSKVPLTGKYPAGDAARFSTYGANSTDPNTTNFWYITPEGAAKWTSRNMISFSRRNIYAAAKGNKIRVRLHARSSLQAQGIRNSDPQWTVSYVIDLTAKTATLDDDFFPLCVDETGLTFPKGKYDQTSNNLFYGYTMCLFVQGDRVTGIGNSDAEDFLVRFRLPNADAFESARWNADWTNSIGNSVNVLGPYASPYILRMRGMAALGGTAKKMLLRQRSTGSCMSIAYDTDTTYGVPDYVGWGPSNDREVVSQNDYEAICRLGQVYNGSQSYLNGASFRKAESRAYRNIAGTTTITNERVTISAEQWSAIENFLDAKIPGWLAIDPTLRIAWLSIFDFGGQNLCVLQTCILTPNATAGGFDNSTYFYRIPMTFDNGIISLSMLGGIEVWKEEKFRVSAVTLNDLAEMSQMRLIKRSDGWLLRTRTLCRVNTSSSSTDLSYLLKISQDLTTWTGTRISFNPSNNEIDYVYLQETDEIAKIGFVMLGVYLGGTVYSGKGIAFETGGRPTILFGPQVAEGMILYITQAVPFFAKMEDHLVPAATFDFKTLFPTDYQDATFYFHVQLNASGVAEYLVSKTQLPDTASRLYIGYATTTSNAITDAKISRVKRLGRVGALLSHADNRYAHGYLPSAAAPDTLYSNMENLGTVDSFAFPSFEDIYNSWYRFSHNNSTVAQPANESELVAWRYVAADDVVECTLNTATFVGFISDELVGDYVFNTVVTSNDGDNDGVAVVLAALKKEDTAANVEQTLCLAIGNSIESHVNLSGLIQLKENYRQASSRLITTLDADTTDLLAWSKWYAHVYAERRGNKLYIAVEHALLPTTGVRDDNIRAIIAAKKGLTLSQLRNTATYKYAEVDLVTAAPTFARSCRFGYGATSQNATRFWNITRPGADLTKSYGTAAALETANQLGGNFNAIQRLTFPASAFPWMLLTNYAEKLWPNVGTRASAYSPPLASPAITLLPESKLAAGTAWATKTSFTPTSSSLVLNVQVDDSVDVYLNGVSKGTLSGNANLTLTGALLNQPNALAFVVKEAPGNSPCYIAFELVQDGTTKLAVSNAAMTGVKLPNPASPTTLTGTNAVGGQTIVVPTGKDYILAMRQSGGAKAPVMFWTEERAFAGGKYVDIYFDATTATVLDVMIHDSTLSV
ncbi:hypothetical protein pEaSNUABM38_00161 [Erwinia phage pEa_SNUABM_38]|nr:hypothetical protein pEaSNUABM38_00161 [Erwinia phage pEa_SNUABM_38]